MKGRCLIYLLLFCLLSTLVIIPQNCNASPTTVTIYSGANDRELLRQTGSTFAITRDATSATVSYDQGDGVMGIDNYYYYSGGNIFMIYRQGIWFNLTSIPSGATVTAVTLSLYITYYYFPGGAPQTGMSVCAALPNYPSRPPVADDYNRAKIGNVLASRTTFTINQYNDFTLGTTDITKNAWSPFYTRIKGDIDNAAPTQHNYISIYLGTATLEAHRPKLVVTYSLWAPTFTSNPITSIYKCQFYSYHVTVNESSTLAVESLPYYIGLLAITTTGAYVNGTFATPGIYSLKIKATSTAGGLTSYQNFSVHVLNIWSPTFTSDPISNTSYGNTYSYLLTCNESVSFSVITKPVWLTLSNGYINGTCVENNSWFVDIRATSTVGTLTQHQSWCIVAPTDIYHNTTVYINTTIFYWSPTFTSNPITNISWNESYSYTITLNESGTLISIDIPSWATLVGNQITGIPNINGTFNFTIGAISTTGSLMSTQSFVVNSMPNVTVSLGLSSNDAIMIGLIILGSGLIFIFVLMRRKR